MSVQAQLLAIALKAFPIKRKLRKLITNPPRSKKPFLPQKFIDNYEVNKMIICDRNVITLKKDKQKQQKHIIFFHGGAYVAEMSPLHWKMIDHLLKNTDCKITVVDYPLIPEHNHNHTLSMAFKTYLQLTTLYQNDQFILMGDSAGGGLAFGLYHKLKNNVNKLPVKMILLSPWLDMTMSNETMLPIVKKDHLLEIETLKKCAESYACNTDLTAPSLSPIYGNLDHLPPTAIFYGSNELFFADCERLKEKLEKENHKVSFVCNPKMQHDWVLFNLPESKQTLTQIINFIQH